MLRRNVCCDGSLNSSLLETFFFTFLICNGSPNTFNSYYYGKQSLMNCVLSISSSTEKLSTIDCLTAYMVEYSNIYHLCTAEHKDILQTLQSFVYEMLPYGDQQTLQRIQNHLDYMYSFSVF